MDLKLQPILQETLEYKIIIRRSLDLMEFTLEIICDIKDRAYIINLDKYADIGTHWIALYTLICYVLICWYTL